MGEQSDYLAYMLRLRRVMRNGRRVWVASLESPHTGERRTFADIAVLFAFLEDKMVRGAVKESPRDERPPPESDEGVARTDLAKEETEGGVP